MSFETVCVKCGSVVRGMIPLMKKDGFWCGGCPCGNSLVTFYGPEHGMTNLVREGKDGIQEPGSDE